MPRKSAVAEPVETAQSTLAFSCTQSQLAKHIAIASKAIPSRTTHPILANLLIVAEDGYVKITGFDLSLAIQTRFPAIITQPGRITLPAKLAGDIISRLPDGELSISVIEDTAKIVTANGRYEIRGMPTDDYPEIPGLESSSTSQLQMSASELLAGIQSTLYCASADETKQILCGIHMVVQDGVDMEFAATDGHRMSRCRRAIHIETDNTATPDFEITVPRKGLVDLEKIVSSLGADSLIGLAAEDGGILFDCGDQKLYTRLLDGQYPNYNQLIPRQFSRKFTIDRRLFLSALERVSVIADHKGSIVKVSIDSEAQEVLIQAESSEIGNGRETIPCQITGEDLTIAFNAKYLAEAIKLQSTEVQVELNTATSPVIITPLGSPVTGLIMPVQVRDS